MSTTDTAKRFPVATLRVGVEEFEPVLTFFPQDVERLAREHLNHCAGCLLCTRGGPWHEIRRQVNAESFEFFYK